MQLRGDTRAAAIQIGAVLLFATLIIALSSYQAVIVPEQNRADELDHNKQVQGDFQDVRHAVLSTASSGTPQSTSVRLGTEFQNRMFFLNPPDPTGTFETEPAGEITIENATGPGTNSYWNGSTRGYNVTRISYEPGYREYHTAPATRLEHSLVYNEFEGGAIATGEQRLFAGETISIVGLAGESRTSHSGTASVDISPRSPGSETIQLVGEDGPLRLTIPTQAPEIWAEQFAEESRVEGIKEHDDHVVVSLEEADENGEAIVYELRAAAVSIDSPEARPPAAYLVGESPENSSVGRPIAVEVRDRYDNPVAGETVSVYRDGERVDEIQANRDGIARYTPDEPGEYELRINDGEVVYERILVHVSADDDGDDNGSDAAFETRWDRGAIAEQEGVTCGENCTIDAGENPDPVLTMGTEPSAQGATITYAGNDTRIAGFDRTMGRTDSDGMDTVSLRPRENGSLTVYTWAGGSGDALELTIENVSDEESPDETRFERLIVHDDSTTIPPGQDGRASYSVEYELSTNETALEVEFENRDWPEASESILSEERAGTIDHEPSSGESNYEDRYTLTITVLSKDGLVLEERVIRDTADGTDPESS